MSAIVGLARRGSAPLPSRAVVERMAAALGHRREPSEGGELFENDEIQLCAVGGSLSISADGQTCVAMDGHITNRPSLIRCSSARPEDRYSKRGVWAGLAAGLGEVLADRLRGFFVYASWNQRDRSLVLARDAAGVRHLVYANTENYLLFASEAKAIFASGLVDRRFDRNSLDDLFSCWFPFPPRTLFEGISELPPAHSMVLRGRSLSAPRRYFRAPFGESRSRLGFRARDAEHELIDRLTESMSRCAPAGENAAVYLSGGLDSALVAALHRKAIGGHLQTLTVRSHDADFDEGGTAGTLANQLGARSYTMTYQEDEAQRFADAAYYGEVPPIAPTLGTAWAASAILRGKGCNVVLTGDGADELFGGHEWHRTDRLRRAFDRRGLSWLWPKLMRWAAGSAGADPGAVEFAAGVLGSSMASVRTRFGGVVPPQYLSWQVLDLYRDELLGRGAEHRVRASNAPPLGFFEVVRPDFGSMHPLEAALSLEFETKMPGFNLVYVDRGASRNGIDARCPFLDRDFIEFAARLPTWFKLGIVRDKVGLRRAARGLVPKQIRKTPKRTPPRQFSVDLVGSRSPEWARELVSPAAIKRANVFDPDTTHRILSEQLHAAPTSFLRFRLDSLIALITGVQLLHDRLLSSNHEQAYPPLAIVEAHPTGGS